MSGLPQPDGSVLELFGSGGGAEVARRLSSTGAERAAARAGPAQRRAAEGGDTGEPVVLAHPDDPASLAIRAVADSLATRSRNLAGRQLPFSPR